VDDQQHQMIGELAERAMSIMSEHCESILIFVTYKNDDDSFRSTFSKGNYYSSLGAVHEWLIQQDQKSRRMEDQRND